MTNEQRIQGAIEAATISIDIAKHGIGKVTGDSEIIRWFVEEAPIDALETLIECQIRHENYEGAAKLKELLLKRNNNEETKKSIKKA